MRWLLCRISLSLSTFYVPSFIAAIHFRAKIQNGLEDSIRPSVRPSVPSVSFLDNIIIRNGKAKGKWVNGKWENVKMVNGKW